MTREKYEALSVTVLKELAKARGMKNISALKKKEVIERMLEEDAKQAGAGQSTEAEKKETERTEPEQRQETGRTQPEQRQETGRVQPEQSCLLYTSPSPRDRG